MSAQETEQKKSKALLSAPPPPPPPPAELIVRVARKEGISPFRQLSEIARLKYGKNKLNVDAYYAHQVYRKDLSKAEKKQFVGPLSNLYLNKSLNPLSDEKLVATLRNKVALGELLAENGLGTTTLQAVAAQEGEHGESKVLATVEEIAKFLRNDAAYPMFGKPTEGSRSIGSAWIASYDKQADKVKLGNGREFDVLDFATEIHEDYAKGFLFQDAVKQHPDITKVAGPAVGSLRLVTLNEGDGPKPLYALWKIPGPKAMSDNFWQDGSMLAYLDIENGNVLSVRRGSGPDTELVETHPVSGEKLVGMQMPNWQAAKDLVTAGHKLLPDFNVIGWDVGQSKDGPVVIEANANPFHTLYQQATGKGIKNPDVWPNIERASEHRKKQASK